MEVEEEEEEEVEDLRAGRRFGTTPWQFSCRCRARGLASLAERVVVLLLAGEGGVEAVGLGLGFRGGYVVGMWYWGRFVLRVGWGLTGDSEQSCGGYSDVVLQWFGDICHRVWIDRRFGTGFCGCYSNVVSLLPAV